MDAGVISALAAVGALFFAWETVRETRKLRREDRLARLPELVAELGLTIPNMGQRTLYHTIPRARLAAMLAALDDPLPNCRLLETGAEFDDSARFASDEARKRVEEVALIALDELAELMDRDRKPLRLHRELPGVA